MPSHRHWDGKQRLAGLRRFAVAISALNVLGYLTELLLEIVESYTTGRPARFRGNPSRFIDFFLSAHISGLAIGMLLYANERLWPVVFAATVAVGSKAQALGGDM
jgi:hypothetical protein